MKLSRKCLAVALAIVTLIAATLSAYAAPAPRTKTLTVGAATVGDIEELTATPTVGPPPTTSFTPTPTFTAAPAATPTPVASAASAPAPTTTSTSTLALAIRRLKAKVEAFRNSGELRNNGLMRSLLSKLDAAEEAVERGNTDAVRGQLQAFINHAEAQRDNGISAGAADELISDARSILAGLTPVAIATPMPVETPSGTPAATATPTYTPSPGTPPPAPTIPPPPLPFTPTATGTPTAGSTQIQLAAGWNLISAPFALQDPTVSAVFAQTAAIIKVSTFENGNWATASRGAEGWSGTLTQIIDGKGYYIYATSPTTLAPQRKPVGPMSPPPSYSLPSGWHMIGYTSSIPTMPVDTYLATLAGKWTSLYRYDATRGWEMARPGGLGFKEMELGTGYWIYLTSPGTLVP